VERLNSRHSSNQGNKNEPKWSRNEESAQEREGKEEEREEHITNHKNEFLSNPGGYKEDLGPPFPLEFLVLTLNTWISGPLSHKHLRGGETLTRMNENANGGGKGDGGSLILFNRAITQSQFCPWIHLSQTT
jgi:hypothetical protein